MFRVRASSLENSKVCTGYSSLAVRGYDDGTVHTAAGTLAHSYLEKCVLAGRQLSMEEFGWESVAKDVLGKFYTDEKSRETWFDVASFTDWLLEKRPDIFSHPSRVTETPLSKTYEKLNCMLTGTADVVIMDNGHLQVIDWKNYSSLDWLPPPESNPQMQAYAVMATDLCHKNGGKVNKVTVTLGLIRHKKLQSFTFDRNGMLVIDSSIEHLLKKAANGYSKFVVGPHCDRCILRSRCRTFLSNKYLMTADMATWDGKVPDGNESALYLQRSIAPAEEMIKRAKGAIKEYINKNDIILDYSSAKKYCKRSWSKKEIRKDKKGRVFNILKKYIGDNAKYAINVSISSIKKAAVSSGCSPEVYSDIVKELEEENTIETRSIDCMKWVKV